MTELRVYNTLSRKKELFTPLQPPFVGMYVCGPTVYSDVHLGNCRTFISFDLIYRYLRHLGYKVRYVRNITDAGHLENDADSGEDKIAKKARLEQLEPMEIVQRYTVDFHRIMEMLNVLPPSIEPTATGHIIEQIEMIKMIIENGHAYEQEGTVYFDVEKYAKQHNYGELSGRNLEDLLTNTRELEGQEQKRGRLDFALWIKAKPEHIMQWPSPWSVGFPGWHIECSAMSQKYLGEYFDIHGGGMDLAPTHHTNEIAQSTACFNHSPSKYWLHTNMLTVNGQKMSKSLGNSFLPRELFSGDHPLLEKGYSPMVVRFFMLQTHYASTLDFSNEALNAAEKGFRKLMNSYKALERVKPSASSSVDVSAIRSEAYAAMNDDFNSPSALAALFDGARIINSAVDGKEQLSAADIEELRKLYKEFLFDVFGLKTEEEASADHEVINGLLQLIIELRNQAKVNKDYATSDQIRQKLKELNIQLKDSKDATTWEMVIS